MPYYLLHNKETGEEHTELMGISECERFLEENPHYERKFNGGPLIHSGRGLGGGLKIDSGFNDVLKNIKSHHNNGIRAGRTTIETK